jgi:hypothetical protein
LKSTGNPLRLIPFVAILASKCENGGKIVFILTEDEDLGQFHPMRKPVRIIRRGRGSKTVGSNEVTANHGVFFASWTDRRDGKAEAIFAAKIVLKQNGAGALEPAVARFDAKAHVK